MQHATVEGDDDGTQENGDINPETDATFEDMQNNWISNHEKLHGILHVCNTNDNKSTTPVHWDVLQYLRCVHTGTTLVI